MASVYGKTAGSYWFLLSEVHLWTPCISSHGEEHRFSSALMALVLWAHIHERTRRRYRLLGPWPYARESGNVSFPLPQEVDHIVGKTRLFVFFSCTFYG